MIEKLSLAIATLIKARVPEHPASIAVMKFSLAVVINTLAIVILSLVISLVTGRVTETTIVLIAFAGLRGISGGIHLKSGDSCVLVTTAIVTLISLVEVNANSVLILTGLSAVLCAVFAPSRIEMQSRIDSKYYPLLKLVSVLVVSTNLIFMSSTLAATYFIQSLTLIRGKKA
ncbi:accessory gene regulator B family protein [Paenibacillus sp. UMB4589-SE434]|uniref:accessory gene regulator B family protein n=1 Tax=Paenibacillus sp. UMB4589-SE434 TaxID=3046314 RepID=UPI00254F77D7|nr:accessory gene regulator B family protein [Paenibacillus sp. UMB4589-SE434]MDK8182142.1 accessory gene regulator B family protein [Paenibacillus sp. UMB4589-SE434]